MRVVPRDEVLEKLAALRHADALGRQLAQDRAVEKLASVSGILMAHSQGTEGELSLEEYELLKEAGYAGLVAKRLGRKLIGAGKATTTGVGKAVADVKSRARSTIKRSKIHPGQSRDWVAPAGKVRPKATGRRYDWSKSRTTQKAAPRASASQAAVEGAQAVQGAQTKTDPKAGGWGRVLPYAGVGALGYGLYKGVPWAARQMEQASTTPMAYGAGWSPVQYGYGRSQYGPSVATMGSGA